MPPVASARNIYSQSGTSYVVRTLCGEWGCKDFSCDRSESDCQKSRELIWFCLSVARYFDDMVRLNFLPFLWFRGMDFAIPSRRFALWWELVSYAIYATFKSFFPSSALLFAAIAQAGVEVGATRHRRRGWVALVGDHWGSDSNGW